MGFSLVYLVQRFIYRVVDFFHHWYVDGSRTIARNYILTLQSADHIFAVKITAKHFFEPLYKDYTIIGHILGVIFRTGRIISGVVVYAFYTIIFAVVYVAWVAIPAVILFYAIRNR
jgi:predicted tellurium resistance membrane protein TerC